MTDKNCAQRIGEQMSRREQYLSVLFDHMNGEDADLAEESTEELDSFPLAIETYTVLRLDLSTGGPADWLEVKLARREPDYAQEVESVTYHFSDWFDHAERAVEDSSPLWAYVESIAETVE